MPRLKANEAETQAVHELIQRAQLRDVEFHEVSARKLDENKQREPNEDSVDLSVQVYHHVDDGVFGILLSTTVLPYRGEIKVSVAAEYDVPDGQPIDDHTVKAFGNEVAVMTLLPFAREAIATMTGRIWNSPFIMPTLARGTIGFDLEQDQVESEPV